MSITTVIFVFTKEEAHWAVDYKKNHPREITKILAPNETSQKILRKAGVSPFDFYTSYYTQPKFYTKELKDISKHAKQIVAWFNNQFQDIEIFGQNVTNIYVSLLEIECMYVWFAWKYYRALETSWRPARYLFSKNNSPALIGGAEHPSFVLAYLISQYFVTKEKIHYFQPPLQFDADVLKAHIGKLVYYAYSSVKKISSKIDFKSPAFVFDANQTYSFLLFSSGINLYYYHDLLPSLIKSTKGLILTGPQTTAEQKLLRTASIPYLSLRDFSQADDAFIVHDEVSRFKKLFFGRLKEISCKTKPSFIPTLELYTCLINTFERVIEKHISRVTSQILLANRAVEKVNPKLIITTHDPGQSAVPFVQAGKKLNKKTAVLLHGWHDVTIGTQHHSEEIILWGKYQYEWYKKTYKINSQKMHIGGFPYLDDLVPNGFWKNKRLVYVVSKQPRVGVLATLYWPDTFSLWLFFNQLFKEAQKGKFGGEFEIRVHSHQNVSEIQELAREYSIAIHINSQIELVEFIKLCDVVISWDTTAIYWPIILGKPLFYTTPLWQNGFLPIAKYKAALIPKGAADFFKQLSILQKDITQLKVLRKNQLKYLKDMLGYIDGSASQHTSAQIKKLIHNFS